jgi:elongation factor Ts
MGASLEDIRELREMTSCGVIDCKKALEEAKGDMKKAQELLQKRGLEIAAKKSSRAALNGRLEAYVHMGNKIAVLVQVNCETDFVAKNSDFCQFAKDLAMHIAAMGPAYISEQDIPKEVLAEAKDPKAFVKESCLLSQPFVKDQSKTIQDCLSALVAKIGENIVIGRFTRYEVGVA